MEGAALAALLAASLCRGGFLGSFVLVQQLLDRSLLVAAGADKILMGVVEIVLIEFELRLRRGRVAVGACL